ncbi:MAG: terminase ATPase subunit family protein [Phenylobacterium sp.]|nr:terminase ATPase subunit family protein [Phenylobacterium sp.]
MAEAEAKPAVDPLTPPAPDPSRRARELYFMGWQVVDIAAFLAIPRGTVASWKSRDKWDEAPAIERVEASLEARLVQLIAKPVKTGGDFKEIDLLGRQVERLARVRRYEAPGGHEGDLNPSIANRNAAPRHKPKRNAISDEQAAKLIAIFEESLFDYQRVWAAAGDERTRVILKSRQIGATWYFAREAFVDALKTGRNQIFLSASKSQAHVFRQYIVAFAKEADVELTGDPIVLPNGATLYFLGTNARTAQGYHGNFYFDEFFWTYGFQELNKVASGMALHKKWRKTYFSTPSSVNHEAHPFWTGDLFNRRRPKDERAEFDLTWKALAAGQVGADRIWRQIVTIEDAERGGCDLFDIDELRFEYSPDQFANLLMCEFIDDTLSVFPMAMMQSCFVDAWVEWEDYKPLAVRPFGNMPVWIGYDPSLTGDSAALVVMAPPATPGGKFRILEKHQFRGMDFAAQAAAIERITKRYNVTYIGIDATGMGQGVYQLVRTFFPTARAISYSAEVKVGLVLKATDTIRRGRLQYDAGWSDVTQSFMAIRKTLTGSGRAVTYDAGRNELTGHADLAWATMHALINEPLEAGAGIAPRSFLEIYE